ncbi:hypothetical protein J22TS3_22250 [Paenibacillus sp. J22TS3]|nr:hypothetical protein J22TS3_22250 [Paenibacillus sp. J22TS3]
MEWTLVWSMKSARIGITPAAIARAITTTYHVLEAMPAFGRSSREGRHIELITSKN